MFIWQQCRTQHPCQSEQLCFRWQRQHLFMASSPFHLSQSTLSPASVLSDTSYLGVRGHWYSPNTTQHQLHHTAVALPGKNLCDSPQTYQNVTCCKSLINTPDCCDVFKNMEMTGYNFWIFCWLALAHHFLSPLFGPAHLCSLALPIICELFGEEAVLLVQVCTLLNTEELQLTTHFLRRCRYNYY